MYEQIDKSIVLLYFVSGRIKQLSGKTIFIASYDACDSGCHFPPRSIAAPITANSSEGYGIFIVFYLFKYPVQFASHGQIIPELIKTRLNSSD